MTPKKWWIAILLLIVSYGATSATPDTELGDPEEASLMPWVVAVWDDEISWKQDHQRAWCLDILLEIHDGDTRSQQPHALFLRGKDMYLAPLEDLRFLGAQEFSPGDTILVCQSERSRKKARVLEKRVAGYQVRFSDGEVAVVESIRTLPIEPFLAPPTPAPTRYLSPLDDSLLSHRFSYDEFEPAVRGIGVPSCWRPTQAR